MMGNIRLSKEEVQQCHTQGFLGPYTLCSPEEMDGFRKRIDEEVLLTDSLSNNRVQARHLDRKVVYDLCTHPAVLDRMACILGENLILWRSNFFNKPPGGKEVPWHQDLNY